MISPKAKKESYTACAFAHAEFVAVGAWPAGREVQHEDGI